MPASKLSACRKMDVVKQFTKILRIEMRIIPKGVMRNQYRESLGDYFLDEKGTLQIRAVEMPDLMYSHYILLHEYMEAIRCYRAGISLESIERWDASHADSDDPGSLKGAPYKREHDQSLTLERIACMQDGYEWQDYDDAEPV
jgi:hypothetical protein